MRMKAGKAGGDFNDASGRRRSRDSTLCSVRAGGGSDAVMCCGVMVCCVVWVCRFRIVWLAYCNNSFLSLSWGVLCCVWVVLGCDDQFSRVSVYCNALCCVVLCCVLCFVFCCVWVVF